jgi:hypothetical protein
MPANAKNDIVAESKKLVLNAKKKKSSKDGLSPGLRDQSVCR